MKIGIVGASASGIYTALLLSRRHPDYSIVVFERMEKAGKKILATGNGHCNLMHVPFVSSFYNHPDFVESLLRKHDEKDLLHTLDDLGVATMKKGELVYPLSYSASAFLSYLLSLCQKQKIEIKTSESVISVREGNLKTNKGSYSFDHIVFAFGGRSQKNLGSDGSMFPALERCGYKVAPLLPCLCPLKSIDVPKSLFGVRHAAKVTLIHNGQTRYEELGEVLFKKDGLSGIAIMNASSFASQKDKIILDLFPDLAQEELSKSIKKSGGSDSSLLSILEKPLAEFVVNKCKKPLKFAEIAAVLKNMSFEISGFYDFDSSQVTRGGIALDQVDENLRSKLCAKHSFVGECLDIDGLCGGYNLGFALLSALTVAESL